MGIIVCTLQVVFSSLYINWQIYQSVLKIGGSRTHYTSWWSTWKSHLRKMRNSKPLCVYWTVQVVLLLQCSAVQALLPLFSTWFVHSTRTFIIASLESLYNSRQFCRLWRQIPCRVYYLNVQSRYISSTCCSIIKAQHRYLQERCTVS